VFATCVLFALTFGCVTHKQVQYFAATDPETGLTNYYKMTVTGSGGLGADYHLQAGYFSAAAVDMLRGSMPDVPELDLPIEQIEVFDRLIQHFYAALIQEAKRVHGVSDPEAILIATRSYRNNSERRLGKLDADAKKVERVLARATGRADKAAAAKTRAQESVDAITSELDSLESDRTTAEDALAEAETALSEATPESRAAAEADVAAKRKALGEIIVQFEKRRSALEPLARRLGEAEAAVAATQRAEDRAHATHESILVDVARNRAALDAANEMLTLLTEKFEAAPMSGLADPTAVQPFQDPKIIELARLIWFGSLSSSDLASIGMTGNTSPYQFRKLVFWATAKNIDLNEFATEIDSVLDNATAIALSAKAQAKQRKAEKKSRRESVSAVLGNLGLDADKTDAIRGLLDLVSPPPAQSNDEPLEGVQP